MVDTDERLVPRQRQRLSCRDANQERAHKSRPDRARNRVDPCLVDSSLNDRPGNDGIQRIEMRTGRDFGDNTSEVGMQIDLCRDDIRDHVVSAHHQRCRRLVTAGLDPKHKRGLIDDESLVGHRAPRISASRAA